MRSTLLMLVLCARLCAAQSTPTLAPTPPMGWNSWDSYGLTINEAQLRDNATAMHDKLLPFGWHYVVLDEGWYFANPEMRPEPEKLIYAMDSFGRFVPDPARFPSSRGSGAAKVDGASRVYADSEGLKAVADAMHAQGLLFGLHIIRGVPKESVRQNTAIAGSEFHAADAADASETCPWDPTSFGVKDNAAGQAWYDSLIAQYALWGVDFLKVDCIADHPYRLSEITQLHRAIAKSGRPMLLSLSPGPTALAHAEELAPLAQMWRISNDIWDVWQTTEPLPDTVKSQFARLAQWAPYARPGNWPDADMLPLGELRPRPDVGPGARHTRLTPDEQQTQVTLWAVTRSPLILGANLTLLDDATLRLLTNRDVIAIDQTAVASREVSHDDDIIQWVADMPDGQQAVAIFNLADTPKVFQLQAEKGVAAKNVWTGEVAKPSGALSVTLPPHGSAMFLLDKGSAH